MIFFSKNRNAMGLMFYIDGRRNPRRAVRLFRYFPVVTSLFMYAHAILAVMDCGLSLADKVAGTSAVGGVVAFYASHDFGFCALHKLLIAYTVMVDCFIWYHKYWGCGIALKSVQWFCAITGTMLFVKLFINRKLFCHDHGSIV